MSFLTSWPPTFTDDQLQELTLRATTYALAHGLLYLPANDSPAPVPSSAIHAPISLLPAPFPRALFTLAQRLQNTYNVLYARVALDTAFLDRVMGAEVGVGMVDEFTGELWRGWKALRHEGVLQPLHLGIFRSDYLLHAPEDGAKPMGLKQVEFNTISSSFGALSERVSGLHRHLQASTKYFDASPHLKAENFPANTTTSAVVDGLAAAHEAYDVKDARVLFVVQPGERNVFDQRWLEYELLERHGAHVIRQTLDQLQTSASLSDAGSLVIRTTPSAPAVEISTIYFRAGYTPTDFPTSAHYAARMLLERSRAIKCPSIPLQLAGGKKIQQVLSQPGVLESFLLDPSRGPESFTQHDADALRATWMGMWGLDEGAPDAPDSGVRRAREGAEGLVLKPQREGGGNNVYRAAIPAFLDALPAREREAWIAMELIAPPAGVGSHLVRAGAGAGGAVRADVVSELGVFGWVLFGEGKVVREGKGQGGWLVRTKGRDSDEGGVAVGFSVLDSVVLFD